MASPVFNNDFPISWCPGCGDYSILTALKQALTDMEVRPHEAVIVSGIGQAAKLCHYLNCNFFNGLHGRALPLASAVKIANSDLRVIVNSGDGDAYGEGGNHFIHALRRNINLTLITHNNQIFGLTKGQASPTAERGTVTRVQTKGVFLTPFNPLAVAVTFEIPFVGRGFAGDIDHLAELMKEAISTDGFSLLDILQPCVVWDRVHTFSWYRERVYKLEESEHDPSDPLAAIQKAKEWGDKIPTGVFYRNREAVSYEEESPVLGDGPLVNRPFDSRKIETLIDSFL